MVTTAGLVNHSTAKLTTPFHHSQPFTIEAFYSITAREAVTSLGSSRSSAGPDTSLISFCGFAYWVFCCISAVRKVCFSLLSMLVSRTPESCLQLWFPQSGSLSIVTNYPYSHEPHEQILDSLPRNQDNPRG